MGQQRVLKAAVIGVGHMGRNHARVYTEMDSTELVAVVDIDDDRARTMADTYNVAPYTDVTDVIDKIDIASIAVPTIAHLDIAAPLIQAGKAVLIEKPLASSVDHGRRILELARKHNVVVQVGHTERFNPVVRTMQRMQVAPRFIESHRISPFTFRSADIGVVMDMMIHDIDIVLSLTRQTPAKVDAVGVSVLSEHEDIANARLTFPDGCVANLTASRLALKTERKIRVFSEQAYLSLDYQKRSGIAIKKDANLDALKLAREQKVDDLAQLSGFDFAKLVKVEPLTITDEEPLVAELSAFVNSVITGDRPAVTAEDGLNALETADRIVQAIQGHNWTLA